MEESLRSTPGIVEAFIISSYPNFSADEREQGVLMEGVEDSSGLEVEHKIRLQW